MATEKDRGLRGCPRYRFKNITQADLLLPEPLPNGVRMIPPGGEFIGEWRYQRMVPEYLQIVQVLPTVPLDAPSYQAEKEALLPLGEKVSVEVVVENQEKKRERVTESLLRELREKQKLSWPQIARKLSYSVTYIRKVASKFGIC